MNSSSDPADNFAGLSDEALAHALQKAAFLYLVEFSNPANGLVADTSRENSPASIAVVGFALSSYPVGVENGWMARADAAERTLKTLQFFSGSEQSADPDATGYKGFYYHFLDMQTGARVWRCELSLIDTALLMAGVLVAACYFDSDRGEEAQIRRLADALYRRVDWRWALMDSCTLSQGWKPECGFLHYGWEGYNEATILYVLGLGSPALPLTDAGYKSWSKTYQWENLLDIDLLYSGPLFTHLFSQAWIDFRGIRDAFMREKNSDYFENTKATVALQRDYCRLNPHAFAGYGRDFWGVTAGDGPGNQDLREGGRDRRFFGYMSRGVPYGPDDGTIAPWAMLATLPFTPEAAFAGTRNLLENYPRVCQSGRFSSGFNPTLRSNRKGWLSEGWYGLDQGLLAMTIENWRTGLIWRLFRSCPYIRTGLKRAGFEGGWL